jgi:predicted transcriptional regulator
MATSATTSLKLNEEIKSRLQDLAGKRRRSTHWLMLEAIQQYVDREEGRERFRSEALEAWTEYQTTGLHVTGEEADAWLARLEAGEDAEPPPPHN